MWSCCVIQAGLEAEVETLNESLDRQTRQLNRSRDGAGPSDAQVAAMALMRTDLLKLKEEMERYRASDYDKAAELVVMQAELEKVCTAETGFVLPHPCRYVSARERKREAE